ncbi:30S ribosomal protein S14 [Salinisphaera japonica]|uniref:Small ribosomal subunit protein uS14 n=1 Tax=Salinisphaera japonica YTM-1 TaxID=1209778 RepID=A0A423PXB7_9GAMM|nr:30S ribosomal protein S14 [Salinisphaera japonica]ROO30102.1 30S ribosomal protein S14 [Salinisphaera japonica YTM-1]|tara:strand:+ start:571 stop:876 length:306 start_codon:yes stop_codon:yes gene_type:complete
MAKKSMIARDKKREKMIAKYAEKRAAIKARINDPEATPEERFAASQELQQLPRDASPARLTRRCRATGRPQAVYRKFGLSRIKLREAAMRGEVPGLTLSSW